MNERGSTSIRLNTLLLPVSLVILALLQVFFPYRGWIMLLIGLGGIWIIAYLWARVLSINLRVRREMRYGWAQVGDMFEERITLVNPGWVPAIWVEIQDGSTVPNYNQNQATGVSGESENSWTTHHICSRRGLFTLGPTTLTSSDPFGIYTVTIHDPSQATLLVTPPLLPLPNIEVASGGRAGEGRRARASMERTVSSTGIRDYVPGDSLRWVHWPTSARRNSYFVKTFDSTPSSDWWIILDLDEKTQVGSGANSTEEASVVLAASLANRGLMSGLAVGLVVNGHKLDWLPPGLGESQRLDILQSLALASPGPHSLGEVLLSSQSSFREQTSLILITSAVKGEWFQHLLAMVWRGVIPTVLLLDPVSFGSTQDPASFAAKLADLELTHYVISAEMLDQHQPDPEQVNAWDWRVLPTGKAVPVHKPKDFTWKTLS